MHLAYSENITSNSITLSTEESLHLTRVLRLNIGAKVKVTDGKGSVGVAIVSSTAKKNVILELVEKKTESTNPYALTVAIAPTKSNDRFEWILEKCTELGIYSFEPIICHHSERKKLNLERCRKIILSAMKQSQKCWLPNISEPIKLNQFLSNGFEGSKLLAHCNKGVKRISITEAITKNRTVICIGPEGDFSESEINLAMNNGFRGIHLGNERLRTETAAIYGTSVFKSLTE